MEAGVASKQLLIGTGWTDHKLCRLGAKGDQTLRIVWFLTITAEVS